MASYPLEPLVSYERNEWDACANERGYVTGNTSDLRNMCFSKPWMWRGFQRAILQRGREFFLTGVALYGPWARNLIRLPKDSEEFFIGDPWGAPEKFVESFRIHCLIVQQHTIPYGYTMHERCWLLATHMLNANLVRAHLGLFINALFEFPRRSDRPIRSFLISPEEDKEAPERNSWQSHPTATLKLVLSRLRSYWHCVTPDPWKVVDIPRLISREVQLQEKTYPGPCSRQKQAIRPLTSIFIPPEVAQIIMDFLPGCWELRALMWAFPHWAHTIPQGYWRTRFIKDLMLEGEELPDADALNWRRAYYKVDRLVKASSGLHDRKFILKFIKRAERIFMDSLSSDSSALSDMVAGKKNNGAAC